METEISPYEKLWRYMHGSVQYGGTERGADHFHTRYDWVPASRRDYLRAHGLSHLDRSPPNNGEIE